MTDTERAELARSLEQFGFLQPVIARGSDRLVIGGHQRIEAARQLGWTEVPVIWWEGSDQDARALNLALNKIQGSWDEAKLADVLAELAGVESLQEALRGFDTTETALAGFDEREVLAALEAKLGDGPRAEDLTALAGALVRAPDRSASAQPGVFYELGPHRLLCGDARDLEAVRRLIGVAEPAMLWTDPPYGVNYSAEGSRGAASSGRPAGRRDRPLGSIAGDDLEPEAHADLVTAALCNAAAVLAPGSAVYPESTDGLGCAGCRARNGRLGGCGSGWWRWQGATVAVRACGQEETAVGRRSQACWRQAVERSARPSGVRSGAGSPAAGRGRR